MSNPLENATQQKSVGSTLEDRVKEVVGQFKTEEDGSITFPDELKKTLDPDTLFAATAEHRRRSTQTGYTKGQQKLKAQEAEIAALRDQLAGVTKVQISKEDQQELDKLKYDDPDKWRTRLNELETASMGESRAKLEELTGEARKAAEVQFELERRQTILDEFNASAEIQITDEVIRNDVPPRITSKLEQGKVTWEEFLQEVATYLGKGRTVKQEEILDGPDLGKVVGGKTPGKETLEKSLSESYSKDTY
jgi:hypothetical protein